MEHGTRKIFPTTSLCTPWHIKSYIPLYTIVSYVISLYLFISHYIPVYPMITGSENPLFLDPPEIRDFSHACCAELVEITHKGTQYVLAYVTERHSVASGECRLAAAEWICFFGGCWRPSMEEKSTDFWWNLLYFTIFCGELVVTNVSRYGD